MLKQPVPSYNDLTPLLLSHESCNKSFISEHANPALAFVGQTPSRSHNKSGNNQSFTSKGKGFSQANARPFHNQTRSETNMTTSRNPNPSRQSQPIRCQICRKPNHVNKLASF